MYLNNFLPLDIVDYIYEILHKELLKSLHKELLKKFIKWDYYLISRFKL